MTRIAHDYANRLIDAIRDCISQSSAAEDPRAYAQQCLSHLRSHPGWLPRDVDRVERVLNRTLQIANPWVVRADQRPRFLAAINPDTAR